MMSGVAKVIRAQYTRSQIDTMKSRSIPTSTRNMRKNLLGKQGLVTCYVPKGLVSTLMIDIYQN